MVCAVLLRRFDSSLRGHAASRNGGCLDTTQHLGSRRHQRTINIIHRYVSWHRATILNVRLWDRQLQPCAHIHARHVPALRDLASSKNGGCPNTPKRLVSWHHQRTVSIIHRYGSRLGATVSNIFLWARQRDHSFSLQHPRNRASRVLGWVASVVRSNPSFKSDPACTGSFHVSSS